MNITCPECEALAAPCGMCIVSLVFSEPAPELHLDQPVTAWSDLQDAERRVVERMVHVGLASPEDYPQVAPVRPRLRRVV